MNGRSPDAMKLQGFLISKDVLSLNYVKSL